MSSAPSDKPALRTNDYPSWSPRFWHGMRMGTWWRLLATNRFQIAPSRLHIALGVSFFAPLNNVLALTQALLYGRQVRQTQLTSAPLFILGHWRSGTTLLHELLVSDPQFASPNTYQCFAPSHFILSEWPITRFGNFLLPKKRPMDNMEAGWQLPQEDEFALMNLGVPTPYLRIAFPKTQGKALEFLTLRDLSERQRQKWREKFLWFLRALTFHHGGKQLVLKSPPHTGRLAELAQLFPDAKFVHLTRDPRSLFASTLRLWKSLEEVQALQLSPCESEMQSYVAECLTRMYEEFERARESVDPSRLIDLRYEDLVADPLQAMRSLYERLDLGDFQRVESQLQERLKHHQGYRPNSHPMDAAQEQAILRQWSEYANRYGYAASPTSDDAAPPAAPAPAPRN